MVFLYMYGIKKVTMMKKKFKKKGIKFKSRYVRDSHTAIPYISAV